MLTMDGRRRRPRRLATTTLGAGLVLSLGVIMPMTAFAADSMGTGMEPVEPDLTGATVTELQTVVADLSVANDELAAANLDLQRTVDELSAERERLQLSLEHFDEIYAPLEADRQLLYELRKTLPESRVEAEAQLSRLRKLALSSNPAGLGQVLDRVEDTAAAFLDWRFADYNSSQEASQAYVTSGANAFDASMNDFRNAVLLSVANRLDGLLNVLDRVR